MPLVAAFYKAIGLALEEEQHGRGPRHFSFSAPVCMEVYPPREPAQASFVLRVETEDVQGALSRLKNLSGAWGRVVQGPKVSASGIKAILEDPDGRIVELFQPATL